MEDSTPGRKQEISLNGIVDDKGSVYDRLHKLHDMQKASEKQYSLVWLLMMILLAKLCGEDKSVGIADWRRNDSRFATLVKKGYGGWKSVL